MPAIAPDQLLNRLAAWPEVARLLSVVRDGPPAFVVGGTTRDLLGGRDPLDLDIVVDEEHPRVVDHRRELEQRPVVVGPADVQWRFQLRRAIKVTGA